MSSHRLKQGFTRIELLTVIAVIGLLTLTQLAGFARHGQVSQAAICLNNLAQLTRAWHLYAEDNRGLIPRASSSAVSTPQWAGGGWLDFSRKQENIDPTITVMKSPLWRYTSQSPTLWQCPADLSTDSYRGSSLYRRVRSYSMNNWINGDPWSQNSSQSNWKIITQLHDFNDLPPVQAFLLMDEHPGSINDNMLFVDMSSYPDNPRDRYMVDFPASGHGGGATVAFVDGHVQLKRWEDSRTTPPYVDRQVLLLNVLHPQNPDIVWLQERAAR